KQRLILVRRAKTLSVEPAAEQSTPTAPPRIQPSELEQYGDTEVVCVVFSPSSFEVDDFANEVKRMLGPFGTVVSLGHANKLVVQDTAANLRRIRTILKDSEHLDKRHNANRAHTCRYKIGRAHV